MSSPALTRIRAATPVDWNVISQTDSFAKIIRLRKLQLAQMHDGFVPMLQSLMARLDDKISAVDGVPHKRRELLSLQRRRATVESRLRELSDRVDEREFEATSQSYIIAHARQVEEDARRSKDDELRDKAPPSLPPGAITPTGLVIPDSRPQRLVGGRAASPQATPTASTLTSTPTSTPTPTGRQPSSALASSAAMDVNKTGDIVHRMYKAISEMADDKQMPVVIRNAGEIVQHMLSAISAAPVIMKAARSNMCRFCNVPLLISTETQMKICPSCRSSACYANSTSSAMQYGEGYESRCTWYPPGSHLNEVLTKQTGRTRSDVSMDTQVRIAKELARMGFRKNQDITQGAVHIAVHNLGLGNAVYKHVPQVTNQLSGRPIPQFTRSQSIQIRIAYRVLQRLFSIMYVGTHQFFTAKFVMYKLCQIFGWVEMFECFPLTSGIDNIDKSTALWNTMMANLGWPVIPNYVE